MKKYLLILIVLLFGQMLFAQINSYIGIVRPQKTEASMKFDEEKMEETLKKNGKKKTEAKEEEDDEDEDEEEEAKKKEESKYDKKIDTTTFGSGFVYVAKDGKNYVITNRHVVGDAEMACFELVDPVSGEKKLYDDLKVVYLSDDMDIALIAFSKKEFKNGFEFYEKEVYDGMEVYSAGFPALKNKPSWQFAKGNISNAKAEIKELMDPKVSFVIQHSAPIDSGNSGGPLLIEDKTTEIGYRVVGINTWKAYNRALAGFTIPVSTLKTFIETALSTKNNDSEDVKSRAEKFAKFLGETPSSVYSSSPFEDCMKYVSNEYADSITLKQFNNVCTQLGISSWAFTSNYNVSQRKYIIARYILTKYKIIRDPEKRKYYKYKVDEESIKKNDDNSYTILFKCEEEKKKNTIETVWTKEFGIWRLKFISFKKGSTDYDVEHKYSMDRDYLIRFEPDGGVSTLNFIIPVFGDNIDEFTFGCSFQGIDFYKYAGTGGGLLWQYKDGVNHLFFDFGLYLGVNFTLGSKLNIIPNVSAHTLFDIVTNNPAGGWAWNAGLIFKIGPVKNPWVIINAFYQDNFIYPLRDNQDNYRYGTVGVGLGWRNF